MQLVFNAEAAAKYGMNDFENIRFDQTVMADYAVVRTSGPIKFKAIGRLIEVTLFQSSWQQRLPNL